MIAVFPGARWLSIFPEYAAAQAVEHARRAAVLRRNGLEASARAQEARIVEYARQLERLLRRRASTSLT